MRLLSICALLAYACAFVLCEEPEDSASQPPILFLPTVAREKFLNTTDPDDLCAIQCDESVKAADETKEFLQKVAKSSVLSQNFTNFAELFDKQKLIKICNDTGTVMKCINACPDRPWKSRMSVLYEPLIYACSGSDFLDHADCIRNVYLEDKKQCETLPQCQTHRDQAVSTVYMTVLSLNAAPESTNVGGSQLMKHMCNYIECANDCRSPEIVAKCGQEANAELLLFYRRFMTSIKLLMSLYHTARTDSELQYEDTCDRLGTVNA